MSQPSEDHRFIDGPGFVEWLMRVRPELEGHVVAVLGSSIQRRLYDWKRGSCPEAFGVPDEICTKLDLHLDEIPDELWLTVRPRVRGKRRPWERQRAVEMLREGYFPTEIAAQLNVAVGTVRRWGEKVAA